MKKFIAVIMATIALSGCGNKDQVYDCGFSKMTVSGDKLISTDENGSLILDKQSDGVYSAMTPAGLMTVNKKGSIFTVSVSMFTKTKSCKVVEGK